MTWTFQRAAAFASAVGLLVVAGCASSRYERSTGEFVDDKMLSNRVKSALNGQPVYKYPDVKVQTYRGVVQLSGFAATREQIGAATEIARQARGVDRVENNIILAPLAEVNQGNYIPGRETQGSGAPGTGTGRTTSEQRQEYREDQLQQQNRLNNTRTNGVYNPARE